MAVPARLPTALAFALACCRKAPPPPPAAPPADAATAPNVSLRAPEAPDAATPCPWSWPDDTALAVEAPAGFEWEAACPVGQLAVAVRVGAAVSVARRPLRPDAAWGAPVGLADDAASLGAPGVSAGALWVPWVTLDGSLRAGRVDANALRTEPVARGSYGSFTGPRVVDARGDQVLVASTYHRLGDDRVVLHRLGVSRAPTAGAALAAGVLAAALQAPSPVVVVATRVPRTPGGPWHVRAHRVDTSLAMAMASPPQPGALGELPEGGAVAGEALPAGGGRFEFTPLAPRSRAMLFQTVVGAERGALRVAWFAEGMAPATVTLPVAATGLGAALDAAGGAVEVTYWDDARAPRRATVTRAGVGAIEGAGAALADERAVQAAARATRWVYCAGVAWVLEARAEGAVARVTARRAACGR